MSKSEGGDNTAAAVAKAPKVDLEVELRVAFAASDEALLRLSKIVDDLGLVRQSVKVTAADGSQLNYDDLPSATTFTNSPLRPASRLHISGSRSQTGYRDDFALALKTGAYDKSATLNLSGPDDWVLKARRDVEEWIHSTRPPYAGVAEIQWIAVFLATNLALVGCAGLFLLRLENSSIPSTSSAWGLLFVMVPLGGLLSLAYGQAAILFRYLFPLGVLSFGQHGPEREKRREYWRQLAMVGVGLGLVVNVVAAALYARAV